LSVKARTQNRNDFRAPAQIETQTVPLLASERLDVCLPFLFPPAPAIEAKMHD